MHPTYPGLLRDNQIAWTSDSPPDLAPGQTVQVIVTLVQADAGVPSDDRGQQMAAILEQLAALPANEDLADPLAWEREIRTDRPLTGREE